MSGTGGLALTLLAAAVVFGLVYFWECLRWWFLGRVGAGIGLFSLMGARVRGVPPRILVEGLLLAREAEERVTPEELETLHLSGGNVRQAMAAVVAARKADLDFSYRMASALTLSGTEPLGAVRDLIAARKERIDAELQLMTGAELAGLRGARGTVEYAVPALGVVSVDRRRLAAVSEGGPIDRGRTVEVVDVHGYIAVVRQSRANQEGEPHA